VHDFAEVVGDESVILGERAGVNFGDLPTGEITVQTVDECLDLKEIRQRL
jgi:hypothetical protein